MSFLSHMLSRLAGRSKAVHLPEMPLGTMSEDPVLTVHDEFIAVASYPKILTVQDFAVVPDEQLLAVDEEPIVRVEEQILATPEDHIVPEEQIPTVHEQITDVIEEPTVDTAPEECIIKDQPDPKEQPTDDVDAHHDQEESDDDVLFISETCHQEESYDDVLFISETQHHQEQSAIQPPPQRRRRCHKAVDDNLRSSDTIIRQKRRIHHDDAVCKKRPRWRHGALKPPSDHSMHLKLAGLCLNKGEMLRDHQRDLLDVVTKNACSAYSILFSAGCGAGKTRASVLSAFIKFPGTIHNIIVVPCEILMSQFIAEIVRATVNLRGLQFSDVPCHHIPKRVAFLTLNCDDKKVRSFANEACGGEKSRKKNGILVGYAESKSFLRSKDLLSFFIVCPQAISTYANKLGMLDHAAVDGQKDCYWRRGLYEQKLDQFFADDNMDDALFVRNKTSEFHGLRPSLIVDECHVTGLGQTSGSTLATILTLTRLHQGSPIPNKLFMSATPVDSKCRHKLCSEVHEELKATHIRVNQCTLIAAKSIVPVCHMPLLEPSEEDAATRLACFLASVNIWGIGQTFERDGEKTNDIANVASVGNGLIAMVKCNTVTHAVEIAKFVKQQISLWRRMGNSLEQKPFFMHPNDVKKQYDVKSVELSEQHFQQQRMAENVDFVDLIRCTKVHLYRKAGDVDPKRCAEQGGLHLVIFPQVLVAGVDWPNVIVAAQFTERKSESFQVVGQYLSRSCRPHCTPTLGRKICGWFVDKYHIDPPKKDGARSVTKSAVIQKKGRGEIGKTQRRWTRANVSSAKSCVLLFHLRDAVYRNSPRHFMDGRSIARSTYASRLAAGATSDVVERQIEERTTSSAQRHLDEVMAKIAQEQSGDRKTSKSDLLKWLDRRVYSTTSLVSESSSKKYEAALDVILQACPHCIVGEKINVSALLRCEEHMEHYKCKWSDHGTVVNKLKELVKIRT